MRQPAHSAAGNASGHLRRFSLSVYTHAGQKSQTVYDKREALQQGTLFPGLDTPFHREMKSRFPAVNNALSELMALDFAVDDWACI